MGFNLNSVIVLVSAAVALVSAFFTWQMSTNETLVTLKSHVEQLQKKPPDTYHSTIESLAAVTAIKEVIKKY